MAKADSERKRHYNARIHKKKDFLHVHLSKPLREKLKTKKRALLVRKGDRVKIMRGSHKGKQGKVSRTSHRKTKVYIEGITSRTARRKEVLVAFEPSNLMLIEREEKIVKELNKEKLEEKQEENKIEESEKEKVEVVKDANRGSK